MIKRKELKKLVAFDASNAVLGRLAALAAKKALEGEQVVIINAEKAVVSGEPKSVVEKYFKRRLQQDKANPEHSAHWPRRPDLLFKRVIRGMLPWRTARGRKAWRRIRVFMGQPRNIAGAQAAQKPTKTSLDLSGEFISLKQLCESLGWKQKI